MVPRILVIVQEKAQQQYQSGISLVGEIFRFFKVFYPDSVLTWNNLGPEICEIETLSGFKTELLKTIPAQKNVHDPDNVRYLYQLRVVPSIHLNIMITVTLRRATSERGHVPPRDFRNGKSSGLEIKTSNRPL